MVTVDTGEGCCYDRGEQERPSADLTTPNALESCLSPHLDFPHDPHSSGKRLFDKRFFGTPTLATN